MVNNTLCGILCTTAQHFYEWQIKQFCVCLWVWQLPVPSLENDSDCNRNTLQWTGIVNRVDSKHRSADCLHGGEDYKHSKMRLKTAGIHHILSWKLPQTSSVMVHLCCSTRNNPQTYESILKFLSHQYNNVFWTFKNNTIACSHHHSSTETCLKSFNSLTSTIWFRQKLCSVCRRDTVVFPALCNLANQKTMSNTSWTLMQCNSCGKPICHAITCLTDMQQFQQSV